MLRSVLLASALVFGVAHVAVAADLSFHATLTPGAEVPSKTSTGSGEAMATLNPVTHELSYTVTFKGLTGPATMAHFHGPALPGTNAGVVVAIGGAGPTSPITGKATLTAAQIADLEAGKIYVNVHTAANPGGEIRGQVTPAS